MKFGDFLSAEKISLSHDEVKSRKKILEILADILSEGQPKLDAHAVFTHLIEREKLGSTALEAGVAVPHCRMPDLDEPRTAVLRIDSAIDYDAPDNMPVSLFFGLLVPQQATDNHLNLLANLVETLSRPGVKEMLMTAEKPENILSTLRQ